MKLVILAVINNFKIFIVFLRVPTTYSSSRCALKVEEPAGGLALAEKNCSPALTTGPPMGSLGDLLTSGY